MAWEYLLEEKTRATTIARWLNDNDLVKGKIIVELACGVASLVKQLEGFSLYYGNDVSKEYIDIARNYYIDNSVFEIKESKDIDIDNVDILVLMGVSTDQEQQSIVKLISLANERKPEIIILEGARYFERKFGLFTIVTELLKSSGYELINKEYIEIESDFHNIRRRAIFYFKKI